MNKNRNRPQCFVYVIMQSNRKLYLFESVYKETLINRWLNFYFKIIIFKIYLILFNVQLFLDSSTAVNLSTPPNKRRFISPRYVGDISSPDVSTPRRAKRSLQLAKISLIKKVQKIRSLQQQNRRLQKKVGCLENLLIHLRQKNLITEQAEETILVWLILFYSKSSSITRTKRCLHPEFVEIQLPKCFIIMKVLFE